MPRIRILHFPGPELAGLCKKSKRKLEFWTKIKILSCCDLTIFFLHLFWNFSVHVLLYKSSSDYNSLLKFFESFKKINFKTPKKFQVSIVIQIGFMKQNVDRKNSKNSETKKIVKLKLLILQIVLKNPKIHWQFLSNLAISGPEKCKIWNLGIIISKIY